MGLKKFNEEEKIDQEEEKLDQAKEEASKLEEIINENSKEEEELKSLPLDEKQKIVTGKIEDARLAYFAYTKKQKKINTIISIGVIIVLIICIVLIFALGEANPWVSYLALGIMVVAVILTFVATKVIKGKLSKQAEEYIKVLYQNVNDYLFSGENFSKLEVKAYGQLKDELFIDAGFYKNIKGTKSRNLVSVYYKDKQMAVADLAANILVKNRLSPMFLGKFYDYTSSYSKEGKRIIMQIKGGQLSRPVDDIDDLKLVESTDAYLIYTNDDEWRKTLNQHTIKDILKLKIDKTLIDVLISIRKDKCSIGIDYIDEFMNIPVEHEFDFNNVKRTELDLNKVLTIFDDLNN